MTVPPYVIPVVLAGGAAATLYFLLHKSAAETPGGGPASTDASFPDPLKAPYQALITSPNADPGAVDVVAAKLAGYGFNTEAQALKVRSSQLRAQRGGGAPAPAPAPSPAPSMPSMPSVPNIPIPNIPVPAPVTADDPLLNMTRPADAAPAGPSAATQAKVTTNDPAPAGDIRVFNAPGGSQSGGAEKNGTVSVMRWNVQGPDGLYAEIAWAGGSRRPAVHGFAHQQYLTPVGGVIAGVGRAKQRDIVGRSKQRDIVGRMIQREVIGRAKQRDIVGGAAGADIVGRAKQRDIVGRMIQRDIVGRSKPRDIVGRMIARDIIGAAAGLASPPAPGGTARVLAPSGFRLRSQPTAQGQTLTIAPKGGVVRVLEIMRGAKGEARSPGQGGWARVVWRGVTGWAPLEWMGAAA